MTAQLNNEVILHQKYSITDFHKLHYVFKITEIILYEKLKYVIPHNFNLKKFQPLFY